MHCLLCSFIESYLAGIGIGILIASPFVILVWLLDKGTEIYSYFKNPKTKHTTEWTTMTREEYKTICKECVVPYYECLKLPSEDRD